MSTETIAAGLISGGLDSTVVAAYMSQEFDQSHFLFADYGQKTVDREKKSFFDLCEFYQPQSAEVIDLTWMRRIGTSALFEEETRLVSANRKHEYVPFRNACLLSAGVALAENVEATAVLIGSTAGDTTCPDNSQAFLDAFQQVVREGTMTETEIDLVAPLINLDKTGVIELGLELGAPLELSWSCHNNNQSIACGECTNCASRLRAFRNLGIDDPLEYES